MKTFTEVEEREILNKVLEEAARLAVEHKLAGLGIELRPGELESIYRKYADITDEPLFKRFFKYTKSPEGRQYFKKTIRTKLWRAGFRPKGWEESDTIFFNVPEARQQLISKGTSSYKVTAWDYGVLEYTGEKDEPIGRPFYTTAASPLEAAEKIARTSRYATEPLGIEEIPAPTTLRGKPGRFFKHQALLLIYQVEVMPK